MAVPRLRRRVHYAARQHLRAVFVGGRVAAAGERSGLMLLPRGAGAVVASASLQGDELLFHEELTPFPDDNTVALAMSMGGERVAVASARGFIGVYHVPVDIITRGVSLREVADGADLALGVGALESAAANGDRAAAARPTGPSCALVRRWRAFHHGSITALALDASGGLVAAGTADGAVRVFDADDARCTHVFNVGHAGGGGGVTDVLFETGQQVLGAVHTGVVHRLDLLRRHDSALSNHTGGQLRIASVRRRGAAATAARAEPDERFAVSAGRDGVLSVWNTTQARLLRTVVVNDAVQSIATSAADAAVVYLACSTTGLRAFDVFKGKELTLDAQRGSAAGRYSEVISVGGRWMCAVGAEENELFMFDTQRGGASLLGTFVGDLDEVYDLGMVADKIAVAYNSPTVRLFEVTDTAMWRLKGSLVGHSSVVVALHVSGELVATASKDSTARVWRVGGAASAQPRVECVYICEGHTDAVGTVALANERKGVAPSFLVTGAADRTLKLWNFPASRSSDAPHQRLTAVWTTVAHDKDINAVALSPDNRLIATASQDRTVKVWTAESGKLCATCRGHRRGVWSVTFSPVDRVVASASADGALRVWSVHSGACLRSLEAHDGAVLRVAFFNAGTQLLSGGADGLVRVWSADDGAAVGEALDAHEQRVWALAVDADGERLVSGGADGQIVVWNDVTELVRQKKRDASAEKALKTQAIDDAVQRGEWKAAIVGALELRRPRQLESIVASVLSRGGSRELDKLVAELCADDTSVIALIEVCVQWNTAAGGASLASTTHALLRGVFTSLSISRARELFSGGGAGQRRLELLRALLAHTRRHYSRVSAMCDATFYLDYTLHKMRALAPPPAPEQRREEESPDDDGAVDASAVARRRRREGGGADGGEDNGGGARGSAANAELGRLRERAKQRRKKRRQSNESDGALHDDAAAQTS